MNAQRVAYLDCGTGVSGDKLLGALLDVGTASGEFTPDDLRDAVTAVAPEAHVETRRVVSHGIDAVSVVVVAKHDPPSRTWRDIRDVLGSSALSDAVRDTALLTFEALARAEAAVHGIAPDAVHFHEVGATDSIADIVGVCAGAHALGLTSLTVGPVAVGGGTVQTSHGPLPIPAPATALLLAGVPVIGGPVEGELTTPTGAALLGTLASGYGFAPPMTIEWTGHGAGTRDIGVPNLCQLVIGQRSAVPSKQPSEPVMLLETNIDHLPPEELAFAAEELLAAGALDVWQTPIVMKKGRAAILLSVLASVESADALVERTIALTGSLGVRLQQVERSCAPREAREVPTPWGLVRLKVGAGRLRPEHDDVARIARAYSLPYSAVVRETVRLAEEPDAIDER